MLVQTSQFGSVEVRNTDLIYFEQGLPGFEELKEFFILKPYPDLPFHYLQSVQEASTAFIVVNPFVFYPNYEFELSESIKMELSVEKEQDVMIWSIVSIKEKVQNATVNLLAPVIINAKQGLGRQVILHGLDYKTKHPLFPVKQNETEGDSPC